MSSPSSLYTSGDAILDNPIESAAVFLVVVVMSACIEYLFTLSGGISSKFYKKVFNTVSEEVLVVGVLSLFLTFGSSMFPTLPTSWSVMFHWTHVCLLFMAIVFVFIFVTLVAIALRQNGKWLKFELSRMLTSDSLDGRELKYKQAYDLFVVSCRAFECPVVPFAAYLLKAEKQGLLDLGDLTWKSWLALSIVVVLNALRSKITPTHPSATDANKLLNENDTVINVIGFILLVGYGTLVAFLYTHILLQRRFRQYLMLRQQSETGGAAPSNAAAPKPKGATTNATPMITRVELDDPQSFLLWQRNSSTMSILQAMLIFFVWYGAVFFLNMFYATFQFNAGLTLLITVMALLPLVVFLYLMPWTLSTVAVLSSLGTNLNRNYVQYIHENPSGGGGGAAPPSSTAVPAGSPTREANKPDTYTPVIEESRVHIDDRSLMRLARRGQDADL